MTPPLGVDDFFILEAGEYLDRLATLAGGTVAPGADELVRFTRALRGSALMANQPAIARAASGLEHLVRAYRDGRRQWEHDAGPLTRDAIDILRTLVERVRDWTPDDTARAERLAISLESSSSAGPPRAPAAPAVANETGVRAFLARESAALGSAIDQAARSLTAGQAGSDLLTAVLRRMQPLRGLAALADYPPLPDLLDGIEETVGAVGRLELTTADGGQRLAAAAVALSRGARDIADRGRPDADALEFRRFASLLLAPAADSTPIVAIESLFFAGEDGIIQRGTAPRGPVGASFSAASVVSRGEHLCQSADEIAEASSDAQRDLRLHVLLNDLRSLDTGLPAGLDVAVGAFAASARGAVARGAAAHDLTGFTSLIRNAGVRLRGYTEAADPATMARAFDALIAGLDMVGAPAVVAPVPEAPALVAPVAPPETLAPVSAPETEAPASDDEIVPIESLAPDEARVVSAVAEAEPAPPVAAAQPVATEDKADGWDLAASWSRYEALLAGEVAGPAPLAAVPEVVAVIGTVTIIETVTVSVPASQEVAEPLAAVAPEEPELAILEIDALCYRGQAARERAQEVRRALRQALATNTQPDAVIPMVDELYDLVELALTP